MPKASPATKKTALLRGFVVVSMGDRPPTVVDAKFNGDECEAGDLVVDCTDMPLEARKVVWARARERGARLLRVSYDGLNNTVVVAEGLPLRGKAQGGYESTPGLDLSYVAGGIGCMAVRAILAGTAPEHVEFQISVSEYTQAPKVAPTPSESPAMGISEAVPEAVEPAKRPRKRKSPVEVAGEPAKESV
jgi:hypothetical protein